jgi:hypothetical protein
VNEPVIDDARLAALLDGRLDAAEREQALARIADSDDDYQVFADAAAILREHEAQGAAAVPEEPQPEPPVAEETRVIPLRRRVRAWPTAAWGALAAVLVAVALIPVLRARGGDPYDPARLAAGVNDGQARLPAGWVSASRWRVNRGVEDPAYEARGARAGALLVDLEVAVRTRNAAATDTVVADLRRTIRGVGYGLDTYEQIASHAGDRPERLSGLLKDAREDIRSLLPPPYVDAGAWTEAALLAAHGRDEAFFRRRESRAEIGRIAGLPLGGEGKAAAERVRVALAAKSAPDWAALKDDLGKILYALGSYVDTTAGDDPAQ